MLTGVTGDSERMDRMAEPYYQGGGITIFHGDCREILPTLPVFDLLLTDPPYGIGEARGRNKSRGCLASPKDYGNDSWDDKPITDELICLIKSKAINQVIFGANYYRNDPSPCWLVWDKDNGNTDFADCELAWTNLKRAVRKFRYRWQGMLQEHGGKDKEYRYHPTQKPVALMAWCLSLVPDAKTVIDPFMGSGTTLRACKDLGIEAVGIEREKRYCDIAIERLRQTSIFKAKKEPDGFLGYPESENGAD